MHLKQRIECRETNEIGVIASDINQMLDKLENVTDSLLGVQEKLYVAELSKRETALSALQSQINPHFLYNTLECIQSIGLVYSIPDISNIALAMAKIFRYSIKGGNFTTIREEIECIRDYLSIMSIRFEGKFVTRIRVDEALMGIQTVKMILQPIVENAIYHGLEQKDTQGRLSISGAFTGDRICFEISDDGIGMSREEADRINAGMQDNGQAAGLAETSQRSIGLNNINSRIQLYYGKEYGIRLYSKENEGTTVIVELPLDAKMLAIGIA
jgi:two-component system sensor histidine kinase YesM